jgi:hypothetical protein
MHQRHRDDPQDYRHVLCHECNPLYEQEQHQWQQDHPIPFTEGMTKQERSVMIQKWADDCHKHMRDWLVSARQK